MPHVAEELFDVRKIDRMIHEGLVTREQYEKYLADLEDCAADADESSIRMTGHDRGGRAQTLGEEQRHEDEEG